ncbi:CRISPR-associated helicase Cas3' [Gramella sp. AN32]|uniref:CRISPR-associated helicase Cas3 n=1 Tax=Christiangramia antarctica TaxID=2058158 RepID=A0ABW5X4Z4_9FLAO|nr:CRISPR-associated helicase Cas3' [Gramella sp. AN32]MCM4154764.1 hypothetical protein [Gramella sp. AN32]
MYNSIKPCSQIIEEFRQSDCLSITLDNVENYLAHTSPIRQKETLEEHLKLVEYYFSQLVDVHGVDDVIDGLIHDYLKSLNLNHPSFSEFVKKVFVYSICYHDHGKINDNFQASSVKMANPLFEELKESYNGLGTNHSRLSAYIFNVHLIKKADELFENEELDLSYLIIFSFSFIILRHHSKFLNEEYLEYLAICSANFKSLLPFLNKFKENYDYKEISDDISDLNYLLLDIKQYSKYAKSFSFYQLLRLNFSLLTASDYLATNEYMNQDRITDFGVLSKTRINRMVQRIQTEDWLDEQGQKRNFNKKTYQELNTLSLEKPITKSNENLNLLRQQMATEAIRNVRENLGERIFYIEAPTGGGKTNISMLVALELLEANPALNKVFYVFPFTTLIDQTYKSIQQSLGLSEIEIVALHSKTSFLKDNEEDDDYGDKRKNYLGHLFLNYPFCLLSHVRFFNMLVTNEKERNYILHRLANSVVVIDELQSYSPKQWDKVIYLIQEYARAYNIRFIIMSATLPKINKLKLEIPVENIVYLLPNARKDYFQNVNFRDRVAFDFSLTEQKIELDYLAEKVLEESQEYAKKDLGTVKPKGSVFTIVEFIFKKSATRFFSEIKQIHNGFFDEVFVLSGTILEHRRRYIINFLKRKGNRDKKILLITTQVVEAGVDIDMDIGFKDKSLLDSDEQLAGRINRNVNKIGCKLFLFDFNRESVIYGDDLRYKMTRTEISKEEEKLILETKNFDLLYDKVIAFKDKRNADKNFSGFNQYHNLVEDLKFRSISDEFQLIDQENISCFIPLNIPVSVCGEETGTEEKIFSASELDFLATFGVQPNADKEICGVQVFDLYVELINSKKSFFKKNLDIKILQSTLAKYVFSLFKTKKFETQIIEFADMEKSDFGYYYIQHWEGFYDEIKGIDDSHFNSVENQLL